MFKRDKDRTKQKKPKTNVTSVQDVYEWIIFENLS